MDPEAVHLRRGARAVMLKDEQATLKGLGFRCSASPPRALVPLNLWTVM